MDHISGVQTSVSRSDRRYGDDDVKKALGVGDFPLELTRNRVVKKEVPAVPFHANATSRFNEEVKIFVAPNQYFNAKFRRIFIRTKIQHSTGQAQRWIVGRIRATGLNLTSQYGKQRQAVEYLVKISIWF